MDKSEELEEKIKLVKRVLEITKNGDRLVWNTRLRYVARNVGVDDCFPWDINHPSSEPPSLAQTLVWDAWRRGKSYLERLEKELQEKPFSHYL